MDAKQIGERIRQHRKKKKLNQTQLGELLGIGTKAVSDYEKGKIKVIPFEKRAKMSSVLNIPVSELLYDNEEMACISTNEAVDELREQEKLIKAVNAELEEWLCSGDVDYLHKAMAVIRAEIDNEEWSINIKRENCNMLQKSLVAVAKKRNNSLEKVAE